MDAHTREVCLLVCVGAQCEDFVGVGGELSDLFATQQKEYHVTHSHSLLKFLPFFQRLHLHFHTHMPMMCVYTQTLEAQVDRLNATILLAETLLLVSRPMPSIRLRTLNVRASAPLE